MEEKISHLKKPKIKAKIMFNFSKYQKQLQYLNTTEKQAFILGMKYQLYRHHICYHKNYLVFKNDQLKLDPNFRSFVLVVQKFNRLNIYVTYSNMYWDKYLYFCFEYGQKYFTSRQKYPAILQLQSDKFLNAFKKYRAKYGKKVTDEDVKIDNNKKYKKFNNDYDNNIKKIMKENGMTDEQIKEIVENNFAIS